MPDLNAATQEAKIRADEHRLKKIKQDLHTLALTTPSPKLKRIANNAKKEIRL